MSAQPTLKVRRECGVCMRSAHLRLGEVANAAVHPALQQMHLGQDHLVVQPLELGKEGVDQG